MDHDPVVFKDMCASQLAHFWSPSITAHVNGEVTTLDFEHEVTGLVISTEAARELYRSLGEQLGDAAMTVPMQGAKAKGEVKLLAGRPRRHWRAKPRTASAS